MQFSSSRCVLDVTWAPSAVTLHVSASCQIFRHTLSVSSSFLSLAKEDQYSLGYFAVSNFNLENIYHLKRSARKILLKSDFFLYFFPRFFYFKTELLSFQYEFRRVFLALGLKWIWRFIVLWSVGAVVRMWTWIFFSSRVLEINQQSICDLQVPVLLTHV